MCNFCCFHGVKVLLSLCCGGNLTDSLVLERLMSRQADKWYGDILIVYCIADCSKSMDIVFFLLLKFCPLLNFLWNIPVWFYDTFKGKPCEVTCECRFYKKNHPIPASLQPTALSEVSLILCHQWRHKKWRSFLKCIQNKYPSKQGKWQWHNLQVEFTFTSEIHE